jgi:hypothetical protein
MRLGIAKERRTFLGNIVGMRILCVQDIEKLVRELVLLRVCPLPSQMMFPTAPPSLMMIAWILQFTVNIQNPRESSGMMMTAFSIFHNLFLHLI